MRYQTYTFENVEKLIEALKQQRLISALGADAGDRTIEGDFAHEVSGKTLTSEQAWKIWLELDKIWLESRKGAFQRQIKSRNRKVKHMAESVTLEVDRKKLREMLEAMGAPNEFIEEFLNKYSDYITQS